MSGIGEEKKKIIIHFCIFIIEFILLICCRKLIRFIRGHEDDIDRVVQKVEKYLDWRTEYRVDDIRRNIVEGGMNSGRYMFQ